jgi:hypothetical protein
MQRMPSTALNFAVVVGQAVHNTSGDALVQMPLLLLMLDVVPALNALKIYCHNSCYQTPHCDQPFENSRFEYIFK